MKNYKSRALCRQVFVLCHAKKVTIQLLLPEACHARLLRLQQGPNSFQEKIEEFVD